MAVEVGRTIQSKTRFVATILAMIAGLENDLTAAMSLTVGGVVMPQAAILARLAAITGLFDAVTTTHNAWRAAVAAKDDGLQPAKQFMADLKKAIESRFGSHDARLPDFGIALPKARATQTTAEKAVAAGLRQQTRQVRGTKGKQQRLLVTVAGKPGLQLLGPDGKPLAGVEDLGAPVPPAAPGSGGNGDASGK